VKTSAFFYDLPRELIAQSPAERRADSRMMVVDRKSGSVTHHHFYDLPDLLDAGDVVVVNDTKVIPARIFGRKAETGGRVELFFLEQIGPFKWEILLRASRRPKPGQRIIFGANDQAEVRLIHELERGRCVVVVHSSEPLEAILEEAGEPPLPPYIDRPDGSKADQDRYQTVFAREAGAVAAPTAGLHFTPETFTQLAGRGVVHTSVTLHVGLGTFRSVTAEELEDHQMEAERYRLSAEAAGVINHARSAGGRVLAVGSTSTRTLETMAAQSLPLQAGEGRSDLFIYPSYEFKLVDIMLTNFHLPESTLIMLVSAFGGQELIMEAYQKAIEQKYRFYSYGDCMLVI
jgi:S-adenosylmethionine:tRNA ribosyltransferase-isomerase